MLKRTVANLTAVYMLLWARVYILILEVLMNRFLHWLKIDDAVGMLLPYRTAIPGTELQVFIYLSVPWHFGLSDNIWTFALLEKSRKPDVKALDVRLLSNCNVDW
jgi:hypothetical protein